MVVYTNEMLETLERRKKILLAAMISVSAVCIAVYVGLCFLIREDNVALMETVLCLMSALCGWFVFGCLFAVILPQNVRITHVRKMLVSPGTKVVGEISDLGSEVTVSRYLSATQVTVEGEETQILYWDNSLGTCPLKAGDIVSLQVSRGFICGYEVSDEE